MSVKPIRLSLGVVYLGLVFAFLVLVPRDGHAITVEVARACEALVAKTFPPRMIGNPAAGSAKGTAREQQTFYQKCVANGGKMDDAAATSNDASKERK